MATELAKAYVQIVPSAQGIKGSISSALNGEADSAGVSAGKTAGGKLVSGMTKAVAVAGIGKAISASISAGADLEQSIGGIETLFKDSSNIVIENAKKAYKTAGISANEYMEQATSFSASLLQSLGGDTKKAASVADMAITDMADNSNKMGTAVENIQNAYQGFAKQNYTMLDNLKLGYGGTKTEMERLLKDAGKLSGQKYDIDNLNDVYEAIHVVQEEMGITGTTSKEAASTLSGSLASMKAACSDLLGNLALGEDVKPAIKNLISTAATFLFENLLPAVGNIILALPDAIGTFITTSIPILVQKGKEIISYIVQGATTGLPAMQTTIMQMIAKVKEYITNELPNMLNQGVEIISNLANGIWESIPTVMTSFGDVVSGILDAILPALPGMMKAGFNLIKKLASGIFNNLPTIVKTLSTVIAKILATIAKHLPKIIKTGYDLLGKLASGIIRAIPKLIAKLPEIFTSIKDSFAKYDWGKLGKNILEGIKDGVLSAIDTLLEAVKDVGNQALDAIKDVLGIHSPSRVFNEEVGKMMDLGIAEGIKRNVNSVTSAMKSLSQDTIGTIDTDFNASISKTTGFTDNNVMSHIGMIYALLSEYLPGIANMQMVTDTGALVGQLAAPMDRELASRLVKKRRGI